MIRGRRAVFLLALAFLIRLAWADNLVPPGPPGSDEAHMKSLNQVEPRAAIEALPYAITHSGAYYLTASLTGVSGSNGVSIACSDVRLDLNRFALVGVSGSQNGIDIADGLANVTIQNGVLRNWGWLGVSASNVTDSLLLSVIVQTNGFGADASGAFLGDTWLVEECLFLDNAKNGLNVKSHGTIRDTKVLRSGWNGILAMNDCRIIGCSSSYNQKSGIVALDHCMIQDCLVSQNVLNGIEVGWYCRVIGNNCANNAQSGTEGAGVQIDFHGNRIENNTVALNKYGIASLGVSTKNLVIRNNAISNTETNYYLLGDDRVGQILIYDAMPAEFTNANPWANFSF
ncbi:MAG: right-handed parallel beta-helix repeat-containing protein [Kiritimatiellae bacterium]|nr:right-handed parallel beta-helix repeat-containing protein [Kiritimatiellia bacterium]